MITHLLHATERIATARTALLLFLCMLPFICVFFPWRSNQLEAFAGYPPRLFDTRLPYTPEQVNTLADYLGQAGRRLYAVTEVTLDFAFPMLYATWLSVILTLVWHKAPPIWESWRWLVLIPYLGMLADFAENACLAALMLLFPHEPNWLVWISNLFSLVKWSAGLASIIMILLGIALSQGEGG
jgi:hypothetical protein